LRRKGACTVPFLIVLITALVLPSFAWAAEKKPKKAVPAQPAPTSRPSGVNDSNVQDYYRSGEEQLKKGRLDEAQRAFQGVHSYTREALLLLQYVKGPYEKALKDGGINQNQKEELYLKLQRMAGLSTRYTALKGESAYNIGTILAKKGDSEQARKYLLDACETVPFSLNPTSTWMKSKNLLLSLFRLEGEF
jgi:tetratricopeptide (TPR) repeat protein